MEVEVRPWREIGICGSTKRTLLSGSIYTMVSPTTSSWRNSSTQTAIDCQSNPRREQQIYIHEGVICKRFLAWPPPTTAGLTTLPRTTSPESLSCSPLGDLQARY